LRAWRSGHIHESWLVDCAKPWLLQRLNTKVFPRPDLLAGNYSVIRTHVSEMVPAPVATRGGGLLWRDRQGSVWRGWEIVAGARPAAPRTAAEAREVGAAFGHFDRRLAALDPAALAVVIPRFHDPADRLAQLEEAAPPGGDATLAQLVALAWLADKLGELTVRVAHHDAKADNILVSEEDGRPLAVIDLDTVMPGSVIWDVGDMVRSVAATAPEDSPQGMGADAELAAAVVEGFVSGFGADALSPAETDALAWAGPVIAWEQAVRFLTDHYRGDVYYGAARPGHNLDRAVAQLRLARALLELA